MATLHTITSQAVGSVRAFRKVPRIKLQAFALDVSLIALGLRTGFLFDSFSVPGERLQIFCELLNALRTSALEFQQVILLHEDKTDGYFFVHAGLLLQRQPGTDWECSVSNPSSLGATSEVVPQTPPIHDTTFVSIASNGVMVMPSPPMPSEKILRDLRDILNSHPSRNAAYPVSITLPTGSETTATDIIPLAAILLEYPVAYVPEGSEQTSFLSDTELVVYSCSLLFDAQSEGLPSRHRFMQFSCPRSLIPAVETLEDELRQKFTCRVRQAGFHWGVEVSSRIERLNRVAL